MAYARVHGEEHTIDFTTKGMVRLRSPQATGTKEERIGAQAHPTALYFEQVVRNFSRYHKYSLGADLRDGARRVLKLIVRANARQDKIELHHDIREETEEVKVVLRLCQDVKAFVNFNSFEHAIGLVTLRYARCATQGGRVGEFRLPE